jgi:hypothetical protein
MHLAIPSLRVYLCSFSSFFQNIKKKKKYITLQLLIQYEIQRRCENAITKLQAPGVLPLL